MIKGFFLTLAAAVLALAGYLFFYLGLYKPVEITVETRPELHLLFKDHLGAYHLIGPILKEVEAWAQKNKIDCAKTFGEFLDDPQAIDQDRLRSRAGCILSGPIQDAASVAPYIYEVRPGRKYVVAHFNGAPGVGPMKVYPKVRDYFADHRLRQAAPVLEVYSVNGDLVTTDYLFPVDP